MIDNEGYRLNVGIIICNHDNQLFWGKRIGQESWQFPQGGVADYESTEQTLIRELYEETGLAKGDIEILSELPEWICYDLPENLVRRYKKPVCIGQKQKWFLVRLIKNDERIALSATERPEFDSWKWVDYWKPLDDVIYFKRDVYKTALTAFASILDPSLEKAL